MHCRFENWVFAANEASWFQLALMFLSKLKKLLTAINYIIYQNIYTWYCSKCYPLFKIHLSCRLFMDAQLHRSQVSHILWIPSKNLSCNSSMVSTGESWFTEFVWFKASYLCESSMNEGIASYEMVTVFLWPDRAV